MRHVFADHVSLRADKNMSTIPLNATSKTMQPRHSRKNSLSQVTEIAHRAITAYNGRDGQEERSQQAGTADPFTFKVPVTLAGLQLHAEFKVSALQRKVLDGSFPRGLGCRALRTGWSNAQGYKHVFQQSSHGIVVLGTAFVV